MTRMIVWVAALVSIPLVASGADKMANMPTSVKPKEFAQWVYGNNKMEVKMAQLAASMASSPQTKQFAQMLVSDHEQMTEKLQALGKEMNVKMTDPAQGAGPMIFPADQKMREATKALYGAMEKMEPTTLDSTFLATMVGMHDMMISRIEWAMPSLASAPMLSQLMTGALPTLKEHRQQAYQLLGKMPSASASSSGPSYGSPGMGTSQPQGSGSARTGNPSNPSSPPPSNNKNKGY